MRSVLCSLDRYSGFDHQCVKIVSLIFFPILIWVSWVSWILASDYVGSVCGQRSDDLVVFWSGMVLLVSHKSGLKSGRISIFQWIGHVLLVSSQIGGPHLQIGELFSIWVWALSSPISIIEWVLSGIYPGARSTMKQDLFSWCFGAGALGLAYWMTKVWPKTGNSLLDFFSFGPSLSGCAQFLGRAFSQHVRDKLRMCNAAPRIESGISEEQTRSPVVCASCLGW
ncbi:hypothetical protein Acr_04g0004360 [Actinidia rufa]|uniref:Uncharacterized protein n=1 Tax=Actinidia rufa TaxID=165716 RepID=A0A7J0EGT4_9ERIC|nr:hypothetical protein Acr_04g0004360 [Actinidia rufa]